MRIYALERKQGNSEWEQMSGCIVIAESVGQARALAHDTETHVPSRSDWTASSVTTCRQVGWALKGKPAGVLLSDVKDA